MRASRRVVVLGCLAGVVLLAAPVVQANDKTAPVQAKKDEVQGLKLTGKLTEDDAKDKVQKNSYAKKHPFTMTAGKSYLIDLTSADFDTFLRLEDSTGKEMASDDDGGEGLNSRLVYKAPKTGTYQIVVTSFPPNQTGKYRLTVTEPKAADVLAERAKTFTRLPVAEQKEVLAGLEKSFAEKKDTLSAQDGRLALQIMMSLESGDRKQAAETARVFAKLLSAASDPKVQATATTIAGVGRRAELLGNKMMVKGKTLDGKDVNWQSYRGKVVLVDFWATWCGPCRAEIPNIKEMYEKYHGAGFDVVGISLDRDKGAVEKYMEKEKLPWMSTYDQDAGKGESMADYYGIIFIPQAILVGRDGRVISMSARGEELGRLLEKHLGNGKKSDSK